MITLGGVIGIAALLFVASMLATRLFRKRWCSMCAAVSGTWLLLLVLYRTGRGGDPVLLAILMGESVVGGLYLFESVARRAKREALLVFRFPLLLCGTLFVYLLLGFTRGIGAALALTGFILLAAAVLYWYRLHPVAQNLVKKLLACCRDW